MPVRSAGRSGNTDSWDGKNEIISSSGVVECNGSGIEVDGVGDVVPDISFPSDVPPITRSAE